MSNVGKNVRWYMQEHDLREQAAAIRLGVSQSTVNRLINTSSSRPNRDPGQSTLQKIAKNMGVSVDALVNADLSVKGFTGPRIAETQAAYQSHAMQPDLDRLGVALTAIDKALQDVVIQGKLGTLAEAVQWAYAETFGVEDLHDRAQRQLYDRLVSAHLRDWDGREREAGAIARGEVQDRQAPAARKAARGRR